MCHLGPRMMHPTSQLWIYCKDCFTILYNERGQERHGIIFLFIWGLYFYIWGFFWKKSYSEQFGCFGTKMIWCPHNFGSAIRVFLINFFFLSKNLIWINLIFLCHFLMFHWVNSKLSQATVTIGSWTHYTLCWLDVFRVCR